MRFVWFNLLSFHFLTSSCSCSLCTIFVPSITNTHQLLSGSRCKSLLQVIVSDSYWFLSVSSHPYSMSSVNLHGEHSMPHFEITSSFFHIPYNADCLDHRQRRRL